LVLGKDGLTGAITMLSPGYKDVLDEAGVVIGQELDLAASIYIDWGSFISAIINFLLIAFVLFMIVRTMNRIAAAKEEAMNGMDIERNAKKAVRKIRKEEKVSKLEAQAIYLKRIEEAKAAKAAEEAAAKAKAEEEARLAEEKAMANTVLLTEIRDLLKNK
jgi:large-conductance mechanosensitive channel